MFILLLLLMKIKNIEKFKMEVHYPFQMVDHFQL